MFAEDAPGGECGARIGSSAASADRDSQVLAPGTFARAGHNDGAAAPSAGPSAAANLGGQPLLVIFADFTPSVRAGSTAASLYNKFFGASGSVKTITKKRPTATLHSHRRRKMTSR